MAIIKIIIKLLILYFVNAQSSDSSVQIIIETVAARVAPVTQAINQITPSAQSMSTATAIALPAQSTAAVESVPCITGTAFGQFLIASPRATAILVSSNTVNITWYFSQEVTKFPATVDIKYATVSNAQRNQWTLLDTVPGTQLSYLWQVPNSATDKYMIRFVPDHKETIVTGYVGNPPCFADGDILPTNSAPFEVVTNVSLVPYADLFGPTSAAKVITLSSVIFIFVFWGFKSFI